MMRTFQQQPLPQKSFQQQMRDALFQQKHPKINLDRNWGDAYNAILIRNLDELKDNLEMQFPDLSDIQIAPYKDEKTALAELNKFISVLHSYQQKIANKLVETPASVSKMDWLHANTSQHSVTSFIHKAEDLKEVFCHLLGVESDGPTE